MINGTFQTLPNVRKHLVLSQYAISSLSNRSTSRKRSKFFFGSLDHSKTHFCDLWMILHYLVIMHNVRKHLVLSKYAISSRSNIPNPRKWPKTSFWFFGSFKNSFLWSLNDPSWPGNIPESWKTFCTVKICNIKSI